MISCVAVPWAVFISRVVDARWTNVTTLRRSGVCLVGPTKNGAAEWEKENDCGVAWDSRKERKQAPGNTK